MVSLISSDTSPSFGPQCNPVLTAVYIVGTLEASRDLGRCGNGIVAASTHYCEYYSSCTLLFPDGCSSFLDEVDAVEHRQETRIDPSQQKKRYVVDAADKEALPTATEELHDLVSKRSLDGIPLLVLGNKSDLPNKLSVDELIEAMDLKSITHREVSCYGISAKEETNLDAVLHWLIARASK